MGPLSEGQRAPAPVAAAPGGVPCVLAAPECPAGVLLHVEDVDEEVRHELVHVRVQVPQVHVDHAALLPAVLGVQEGTSLRLPTGEGVHAIVVTVGRVPRLDGRMQDEPQARVVQDDGRQVAPCVCPALVRDAAETEEHLGASEILLERVHIELEEERLGALEVIHERVHVQLEVGMGAEVRHHPHEGVERRILRAGLSQRAPVRIVEFHQAERHLMLACLLIIQGEACAGCPHGHA
mmetsp:Transcript_67136/g.199632  ORF Transcript_67136/g.199632 Transcript_67136/m.199632 type:complete len:237 (-) Transcript_67136:136-846(-)